MELLCRLTSVGVHPVLQVSGEVDLATLPSFRDGLRHAVDQHRGERLWVDLDGVTVLDDSGLGMLLGAAAHAREADGDLTVVCTGERLLHRFSLSGLDRAVEVHHSLPR